MLRLATTTWLSNSVVSASPVHWFAFHQFARARNELFGFPFYFGGSLEVANATDFRADLARDAIFEGSIFLGVDLPIAPLSFS